MTTLPNPVKMLENQQSENENFSEAFLILLLIQISAMKKKRDLKNLENTRFGEFEAIGSFIVAR